MDTSVQCLPERTLQVPDAKFQESTSDYLWKLIANILSLFKKGSIKS